MAIIGTATLNVVPKITNVSAALDKAFAGSGATYGQQLGNQVTSGFKQSVAGGAIIGAFSQVTSMALSGISSSVSSAVNRLDTLKNYPRVMDSLGYSTDEVAASLSTMDSHLQGLPTALNTMTSTVQGLAAITGDLTLATDAGLALNDMLLAGGGNMQVAASAGEQFRQMLSKGKPDMQDWKSIMAAAPGQMNQLAESMLGAGASASDLYYALGGGSESDVHMEGIEYASVSMTDLLNAIVKLDQEGGDGIASFEEQAKNATGGIQTSMANLQNAITRGLANVFDAIGQDRIREAIEWVKGGIDTAFTAVKNVVSAIMPIADAIAPAFKIAVPSILAFTAAFTGVGKIAPKIANVMNKASTAVFNMSVGVSNKSLQSGMVNAATNLGAIGKGASKAAQNLPLIGAAVAGVTAVISIAAEVYEEATREVREHQEALDKLDSANDNLASSTGVVSDALARTKSGLEETSKAAEDTRTTITDLAESQQNAADSIKDTNTKAQATIGQLDAAREIIEKLGGQSDLTAEQQGALRAAIETVNRECGTQYQVVDAANGVIADEEGQIIDTKDAIYDYIKAKEEQVKIDAYSAELETLYQSRAKAADAMIEAQKNLATYEEQYGDTIERVQKAIATGTESGVTQEMWEQYDVWRKLKDGVDETTEAYETNDAAIENTMTKMGMVAEATDDVKGSVDEFVHSHADFFGQLRDGLSAEQLIDDLNSVGITQERLSSLSDRDLAKLAASYKGTRDSVVQAFDEIETGAHDVAGAVDSIPGDVNTNIHSTGAEVVQSAVDKIKSRLDEITAKQYEVRVGVTTFAEGVVNSIVGNEAGAFIQEHASGAYIVDRPTVVSTAGAIHIAGENGAELVEKDGRSTSILPIEKSQYVNRFGAAVGKYLNSGARNAPYIVMYNTQREGESVGAFAQRVAQELKWRL